MTNNNNNGNGRKPPRFHCKSEAQKRAIRASYAKQKAQSQTNKTEFSNKFPFWARLKYAKHRTTLVIDEDVAMDKQKHKVVPGYVHREATHTQNDDYEEVMPNPDKTDPDPMYLKRPKKTPKRLLEPHNKDLDMPQKFIERYDKNNHKHDEDGDPNN